MQRTGEAMKNVYNALNDMLTQTFKQCDKQIDEGDNQEYWMRLKKNLPKPQTTPASRGGNAGAPDHSAIQRDYEMSSIFRL